MRLAIVTLALGLALSGSTSSAQPSDYSALVATYRQGGFDEAIDTFRKLPMSPDRVREINGWIRAQEKEKEKGVDDLAAALMLHSEAVFVDHAEDASIAGVLAKARVHQELVTRLHRSLSSLAPRTAFMRTWYLLWESFRQGFLLPELDRQTDYLEGALEAFPDDAYVLLAAGSRYELYWWISPDNPGRDPSGPENVASRPLRTAEEFLRKSVASDPSAPEPHLRLARVLFLQGSLDAAQSELSLIKTQDPNYRYLAELFIGEVRERAGDREGAAAAYARAIALVGAPQAARIAAAHLAHGSGRRAEAADVLTRALSAAPTEGDPWSAYFRGQWWHLQNRLRRARSLVLALPAPAAK